MRIYESCNWTWTWTFLFGTVLGEGAGGMCLVKEWGG